ncbi:hypothetical protein HMPREF1155_0308 [Slackia sp. CM382]|nr:hypothetical protein HMPREF1155_0308 [Slackia sp. CM382]
MPLTSADEPFVIRIAGLREVFKDNRIRIDVRCSMWSL